MLLLSNRMLLLFLLNLQFLVDFSYFLFRLLLNSYIHFFVCVCLFTQHCRVLGHFLQHFFSLWSDLVKKRQQQQQTAAKAVKEYRKKDANHLLIDFSGQSLSVCVCLGPKTAAFSGTFCCCQASSGDQFDLLLIVSIISSSSSSVEIILIIRMDVFLSRRKRRKRKKRSVFGYFERAKMPSFLRLTDDKIRS